MSWWKSLFPKRASDAQMNSELRFHIDELTDENIAAGMSPGEARRRALLEFGGQEKFKEEVRDVYRIRILDATVSNLKSAFRFIRKSPTFSAAIILTLALAIGANSAVFSAIDAILLRALPFPDADQLVRVDQYNQKTSSPLHLVAPVRLEDWNRLNSTLGAHRLLQRRCLRVHRLSAGKDNSRLGFAPFLSSLGCFPRVGPRIYSRRGDPQRTGRGPD